MEEKDKQELIAAWLESAHDDWRVVQQLYEGKSYYHALFFCQLVLEKILKAVCVKHTNDFPPVTHDLILLITKSNVAVSDEQQKQLVEITRFNIEARYDIFKKQLYRKATPAYTKMYIEITQQLMYFFKKSL